MRWRQVLGREGNLAADARHQAALDRSFSWAEQAAAEGDYASAVAWLNMVESVEDSLPADWLALRRRWEEALVEQSKAAMS